MATEGVSSLYERLGGVYSIATEAHHRVPPA